MQTEYSFFELLFLEIIRVRSTVETFLVSLQMQLVRTGFLACKTCYKSLKHFQTFYLVSTDFDFPYTMLKLLFYKKSYQNFKRKQSGLDQLSGLPRKAELQIKNNCFYKSDENNYFLSRLDEN